MEQSCFGPMHDPTPAVPFHHFGVRLDHAPLKMGWTMDGRRLYTALPADNVSIIPAGASATAWWDRPVDFACLYFTPASLAPAAGEERPEAANLQIRPAIAVRAPSIASLIRALHADAVAAYTIRLIINHAAYR